jgi:hypothetical protein
VWQVSQVVATIMIPWVLVAYFFGSHTQTITDEARLVADFHMIAAIAAGALLLITTGLRLFGRSVAATVPFAIMWVITLAFSVSQIRECGDQFQCDAELCMPGFGLFLTAVPFAIVVTFAVLGSAALSVATRRADDRSQ